MDLTLTPAQLELQARARAYVVDHLQPIEVEFERAGGRLPSETRDRLKRAAVDARLQGGSFPRGLGGQGWTVLEQVIVHEQLGQARSGRGPDPVPDARPLPSDHVASETPPLSIR